MNLFYLAIQFFVSGAIVVGATLLAKYIDPKWSGLLVALPTMTIIALIFIQLNASSDDIQTYLKSAILFMIPAAIFIGSLLMLNQKTGVLLSLILSTVPFALAVFAVQKLI